MGKHSGAEMEEEPLPPAIDRKRLVNLAAGMTVTMVAWGFLVWAAIDFGSQGRKGEGAAWLFAFFATLGATACLFMTLILGIKVSGVLKGEEPVQRVRAGGGRRAAR